MVLIGFLNEYKQHAPRKKARIWTTIGYLEGDAESFRYLDAFARELQSDLCVSCSRLSGLKTAALIFGGVEWDYYYCYQCHLWFKRHFDQRYAVAQIYDRRVIEMLTRRITLEREMAGGVISYTSLIKRISMGMKKLFRKLYTG